MAMINKLMGVGAAMSAGINWSSFFATIFHQ